MVKKRDFLKIIDLYSKCLNCNFFANLWRRDWPFEIPEKVCLMNLKLKFYVMLKGLHLGKHFVLFFDVLKTILNPKVIYLTFLFSIPFNKRCLGRPNYIFIIIKSGYFIIKKIFSSNPYKNSVFGDFRDFFFSFCLFFCPKKCRKVLDFIYVK